MEKIHESGGYGTLQHTDVIADPGQDLARGMLGIEPAALMQQTVVEVVPQIVGGAETDNLEEISVEESGQATAGHHQDQQQGHEIDHRAFVDPEGLFQLSVELQQTAVQVELPSARRLGFRFDPRLSATGHHILQGPVRLHHIGEHHLKHHEHQDAAGGVDQSRSQGQPQTTEVGLEVRSHEAQERHARVSTKRRAMASAARALAPELPNALRSSARSLRMV